MRGGVLQTGTGFGITRIILISAGNPVLQGREEVVAGI
jgi:hypothetical protein